jgi:hypothetical protein
VGFQNLKRALGEDSSHIYILLGFEDTLFFVIIPFLKVKVFSEKAEIIFIIQKISFEGSKNSRFDSAPNELK